MSELRAQAEELERNQAQEQDVKLLSPLAIEQLVRELRIHHFELEIQNEELRRAQLELESAQNRYFELYNRAPVGYLSLDPAGIIRQANLAAVRLLGQPKTQLLGRALTQFVWSGDQDVLYLLHKSLKKDGEALTCELRLKENESWVQLTASLDVETGGKRVVRLVMEDIEERKQLAAENAQISQRLLQSQKLESIGRLAGGIAHEFNNMLTVILAHAQLATDQLTAAHPCGEDLRQIQAAGQRSAKLVKLLLSFARKQQVTPQVMHLAQTTASLQESLSPLIGDKIQLSVTADETPWAICIDPEQLIQVLTQLCYNAREAMNGKGSISIKMSNQSYDEGACAGQSDCTPGDYLQVQVQDSGCGIAAEDLPHLFEPFFTTKKGVPGKGLGLASVYGSVRQNRGFMKVTSVQGEGSTFEINLPRHIEANPEPQRQRILVVEDEPAILSLVTKILQNQNYEVLAAEGPMQALEIASRLSQGIDLLLSDILMPQMNGRDLASHFRALHPNAKILLMSGYSTDILSTDNPAEAEIQFIQKPFANSDLVARVRKLLDQA